MKPAIFRRFGASFQPALSCLSFVGLGVDLEPGSVGADSTVANFVGVNTDSVEADFMGADFSPGSKSFAGSSGPTAADSGPDLKTVRKSVLNSGSAGSFGPVAADFPGADFVGASE